jgi:NAD(P)-dependent dehydrogenase (short-subunit alcohol dehydrogenase family)
MPVPDQAANHLATTQRRPELTGQTVVVIGGSAGIGLETARRARAEGAEVILTARNPDRLERAAAELGALNSAAFDATNPAALDRFFGDLPEAIAHVMVKGGGPYYARLADLDRERAHCDFDDHRGWPLPSHSTPSGACGPAVHGRHRRTRTGTGPIAHCGGHLRAARPDCEPGGRSGADQGLPHRRRLRRHAVIGVALLGDQLDARREQLRTTLPIGRVVGPADIAALAVHLMTNTAITGATYDIDGANN